MAAQRFGDDPVDVEPVPDDTGLIVTLGAAGAGMLM